MHNTGVTRFSLTTALIDCSGESDSRKHFGDIYVQLFLPFFAWTGKRCHAATFNMARIGAAALALSAVALVLPLHVVAVAGGGRRPLVWGLDLGNDNM